MDSVIKRNGNKRQLLDRTDFTKYFPPCNRTGFYWEMFLGTGAVAFDYLGRMKRDGRIVGAVLNDLDDQLIQFFEYLQDHQDELERALEWRWFGSERTCKHQIVKWYLENQAKARFTKPATLVKHFNQFKEILDFHQIQFTNKDWKQFLSAAHANRARCDTRDSNLVLYCDPPYDSTEGYDHPFDLGEFLDGMNDYKREIEEHAGLNAYVFISLNKTDLVDEKLSGWHSKAIYEFLGSKTRKSRTEMLYSNFPIKNRSVNQISRYFK